MFKILEHEAFKIARRCPGTKRSIKYDDRTRSLALDVKLPDSAWVRINPDQIVTASRGRKKEKVPEVAEILRLANEEFSPANVAGANGEPVGSGRGVQDDDDEMGDSGQQE